MKQIGAQEFVRRLKKLIEDPDCRFTFFLGAGCSVSSGIPSAGALVKSWFPKLKRIKTGNDDELAEWINKEFSDYDVSNPAQFYGTIIEELFLNREERQKEIERLIERKDPGYGYAVLAQLMSHQSHGRHCNVVLTTNFDDMVADALYLYTNQKPLVITHESLAGFVRISSTRPLVLKLHGDARLAPLNTDKETTELDEEVKRVLKNLLAETGLIFSGYGGHDNSIGSILKELPKSALPWGVFWIGDVIPDNAMGEWLKDRDAVWVKHRDFDELMLLLQNEFDFEEPDWKRFDKLSDKYIETFKSLKNKVDAKPDTAEKEVLEKAVEETTKKFKSWWSVDIEAEKYEKSDPDKADSIYNEGIKQFHNNPDLLGNYAVFLCNIRKDYDRAETLYKKTLELDPNDAHHMGNYANFLYNIRKDYEGAETLYKKALKFDLNHADNNGNYAGFLFARGRSIEGKKILNKAFSLIGDRQDLLLECLFYEYAHNEKEAEKKLRLIEIKKLVISGVKSPDWDLSGNVVSALKVEFSEPEFLDTLAKVIADKVDVKELEKFEVWKNVDIE